MNSLNPNAKPWTPYKHLRSYMLKVKLLVPPERLVDFGKHEKENQLHMLKIPISNIERDLLHNYRIIDQNGSGSLVFAIKKNYKRIIDVMKFSYIDRFYVEEKGDG